MDTTFDFEKKRNTAVKYDRELYTDTVKAIKRINEIKDRRQKAFFDARMKGKAKEEYIKGVKELLAEKEKFPSIQIHSKMPEELEVLEKKKEEHLKMVLETETKQVREIKMKSPAKNALSLKVKEKKERVTQSN
eukprot:TRINITY_DN2005_c0_g1_i1.p1 TRINITY_DN2005_c0_g1~~TRINITY_DN2005_c0_g1_i1.p1  ORF type:complete len:134 (-),score=52.23 TRINITY_DN2005_c0_g1_i1:41-442(-)